MPSAKIVRFPFRRRPRRRPDQPVRFIIRLHHDPETEAFGLMLLATLILAFLYFSGVGGLARHDALYGTLLAVAWAPFFFWDKLRRAQRVGRFFGYAARLLVGIGGVLFFGFVYWLILKR